jgi:hypothetical protein
VLRRAYSGTEKHAPKSTTSFIEILFCDRKHAEPGDWEIVMAQGNMPQPPKIPFDYDVKCEIELTPEQRRIVREQTGREMHELILEDSDGLITHRMKSSNPDDFTILAIRQAKRLNEYDEDYHEYLKELAEWQAAQNSPDPMDDLNDAMEIAALQEAERLKLFYEKEAQECQNAREIAKIVWGKKDNPGSAQ